MKLVISITSVISLLITKRIQFANCTTLTWTTECATWFMDLRLLRSNHALMMTWYPGQASRVMIYHVAIYKLKSFQMIAYSINLKYWIFDTEVTTTAVPTTAPETGRYILVCFDKNVLEHTLNCDESYFGDCFIQNILYSNKTYILPILKLSQMFCIDRIAFWYWHYQSFDIDLTLTWIGSRHQ